MNQIKRIFIIFLTFGSFVTMHSMQRLTNRATTTTSSKISRNFLPKFNPEKFKTYRKKASEKIYNAYAKIFLHPFYINWFEPLYVGNKAEIWGNQFSNLYNDPYGLYIYLIQQINHYTFHELIYQKWKNNLTSEQLLQHQDLINSYEDAYNRYYINPSDPDYQKELMFQKEKIAHAFNEHPVFSSDEIEGS